MGHASPLNEVQRAGALAFRSGAIGNVPDGLYPTLTRRRWGVAYGRFQSAYFLEGLGFVLPKPAEMRFEVLVGTRAREPFHPSAEPQRRFGPRPRASAVNAMVARMLAQPGISALSPSVAGLALPMYGWGLYNYEQTGQGERGGSILPIVPSSTGRFKDCKHLRQDLQSLKPSRSLDRGRAPARPTFCPPLQCFGHETSKVGPSAPTTFHWVGTLGRLAVFERPRPLCIAHNVRTRGPSQTAICGGPSRTLSK